ncbi:MAG: hypothetical protein WBI63_04445 [Coriobacteriia bacterium]
MRRVFVIIALVTCAALVGCTTVSAIDYRSSLTEESTRTAGLRETTLPPVAFKAAAKSDTAIAGESSGGITGGSGGGITGGSSASAQGYIAQLLTSPVGTCSSTGNVTLIAKVYTSDTRRPVAATVYATCTYKCGGSQSKTYTIKTSTSGAGTKVVDATPYDLPTKVTISGYAMVGGTRVKLSGTSYSTN